MEGRNNWLFVSDPQEFRISWSNSSVETAGAAMNNSAGDRPWQWFYWAWVHWWGFCPYPYVAVTSHFYIEKNHAELLFTHFQGFITLNEEATMNALHLYHRKFTTICKFFCEAGIICENFCFSDLSNNKFPFFTRTSWDFSREGILSASCSPWLARTDQQSLEPLMFIDLFPRFRSLLGFLTTIKAGPEEGAFNGSLRSINILR